MLQNNYQPLIGILVDKSFPKEIFKSQIIPLIKNISQKKEAKIIAIEKSYFIKDIVDFPIEIYKTYFSLVSRCNCSIIYLRGIIEFYQIYFYRFILRKNFKIYYDFRGLAFTESQLKHNSKIRSRTIMYMEKCIFLKADKIYAVSNKLINFLKNNFGNREITLMPCYIDKVIKKDYSTFHDGDKINFVYIGGASEWQKIDLMIDVFSNFQVNYSNSYLTIFTQDFDRMNSKLLSKKIFNIEIIKENDRQKLIENLEKFDFGFILRDNILLNNVSSPIKFAEYIGNGVIPIISNGVGDYSELTKNNNIGIVLTNNTLNYKEIESKLTDPDIHSRIFENAKSLSWTDNTIDF